MNFCTTLKHISFCYFSGMCDGIYEIKTYIKPTLKQLNYAVQN